MNGLSYLFTTANYNDLTIFSRSLKIFDKIFTTKSVPLYKLKLIYELNQELFRELEDLKNTLHAKYGV